MGWQDKVNEILGMPPSMAYGPTGGGQGTLASERKMPGEKSIAEIMSKYAPEDIKKAAEVIDSPYKGLDRAGPLPGPGGMPATAMPPMINPNYPTSGLLPDPMMEQVPGLPPSGRGQLPAQTGDEFLNYDKFSRQTGQPIYGDSGPQPRGVPPEQPFQPGALPMNYPDPREDGGQLAKKPWLEEPHNYLPDIIGGVSSFVGDMKDTVGSALSGVGNFITGDNFDNMPPSAAPAKPAGLGAVPNPSAHHPDEGGSNSPEYDKERQKAAADLANRDRAVTPNRITPATTSAPQAGSTAQPGSAGLAENAVQSKAELNWMQRQAEKLGSDTTEKRDNLGSFLIGFGKEFASNPDGIGAALASGIAAGEEGRMLNKDTLRRVAEEDRQIQWSKEEMDMKREAAAAARADRAYNLDQRSKAEKSPTADPNSPYYGLDDKTYSNLAAIDWLRQHGYVIPNADLPYIALGQKPPSSSAGLDLGAMVAPSQ